MVEPVIIPPEVVILPDAEIIETPLTAPDVILAVPSVNFVAFNVPVEG